MEHNHVLLVDDEEDVLFGVSRYLSRQGFEIRTASRLREAKEAARAEFFDAVLLDLRLPDGNSLDWIPELHTSSEQTCIIVVSGMDDLITAVRAIKSGAARFLPKPVGVEELTSAVIKGIEIERIKAMEPADDPLPPAA